MFNAFQSDAFSADFMNGAFDTDSVRKSFYEQGVKMLDMQQKLASMQLEQMKVFTEASHKQATALVELQAKAMQDGIGMMLDAEKSAVDMWKPTES